MRSVRFVCLFAILISMLVWAQSDRAPVVNQPNGMPMAQQRHPALPSNLSQMPHELPFVRRGAGRFKAAAPLSGNFQASGLNFAGVVIYDSGGYQALSIAVADVNGDGKPDLLLTNCGTAGSDNCNNGTVGVLLGNGDGTFQTVVTYSSGGLNATSVAVADVNGDGKPDLLVANQCIDNNCRSGSLGVLLGNGDGTFQTVVTYGSGGYDALSVAVADVNGDGKPDLLVANECIDRNCASGLLGVLLGNGDGTFQTVVTYGSGGPTARSVAVEDVNGDGKPDLLVANLCIDSNCSSGSLGVLLGNGDGTFQTAVTYGSGGYEALSVAVADVNGDGKPDLLVTNCGATNSCNNDTVGVLLGNGDGTFQTVVTYGSGGFGAESVAVGDVNGDGKPDLLVANCGATNSCNNGTVGVLLGNGDGTFQTVVTYGSGGFGAESVAVGDVNGDGKPDLLVANCGATNSCSNGAVGVLINTSLDGTTTSLSSSQNPSNFGQAVTFTATVTGQQGFYKGMPTGTVSFYDGTTNIGKSNLNSGTATLTTSTLAVGTHSMTATYNGDTNFAPSTSPPLKQVVQGAIAALSPGSLNFGNQTVGITSSPQNVTLTNNGNINLTISLIQITGANSSDFNQTNNCPASLTPNNSCQIGVTFTPTTTGTRNGAVSVTDNAPGSPQSVPLTGVGVVPAVTFSPTSLTFPTQLVFTASKAQPVTLTNSGAGVLKIKHIGVTGAFSQTNNCPGSLASGANCMISVKFHPGNKGVLHGAVSVTDNASGSPQKVPLTGTGTFVQLTPEKLNFGTQPVGTRSLAKKITLTNKGDSAVKITGIAITGSDAGDFAETNNCGNSVASGASCFIKVTFKPLSKGNRTADVSIYDNGGGSPQEVKLIGTGT
jgi:Bacterial Ig-like domain (group 3)/FG-GAP-like repeat/Abnormal spindle-like microcephaly-assoc'd, ASPM-SPD-2-Hydin